MKLTIKMGGKKPDISLSIDHNTTIGELRQVLYRGEMLRVHPNRQAFRTEAKGSLLKEDVTIEKAAPENQLFFKDLGPQVGWTTVFLTEYAGPLVIYLIFFARPQLIYGPTSRLDTKRPEVYVAAACWTFHYAKRLLETIFIHRFSHATMPWTNIVKNSSYYWGFTAAVAYYVNHPLYTPPSYGQNQFFFGLGMFIFCELGNLSIHLAFRDMRPAGSKKRAIPYPRKNPFTWLFAYVSCPNYTYEVGAWVGFTIMTQTLTAGLFTFCGFYQMAIWALGKHRNYKKEFKDYPKGRKAMIPFLL